VLIVLNFITLLTLALCIHLQIKSKEIMWDKTIILPRTTHTPTLTIQGGETTPTSHGVTIRSSKFSRAAKEFPTSSSTSSRAKEGGLRESCDAIGEVTRPIYGGGETVSE
jgi:hypothetical protein